MQAEDLEASAGEEEDVLPGWDPDELVVWEDEEEEDEQVILPLDCGWVRQLG